MYLDRSVDPGTCLHDKKITTTCFHHKPFLSEDFYNGVHGLMNPAIVKRLKDD